MSAHISLLASRAVVLLQALVVFVAALFAVGMFLPVEHVSTAEAHFEAPPELVYGVASDVEAMPEWRSGFDRVERVEVQRGKKAWRDVKSRKAHPVWVAANEPPRRLTSSIISRSAPWRGFWVYTFRETSDRPGTTVTITQRGEIRNPAARVFARLDGSRAARRHLRDLVSHVETESGGAGSALVVGLTLVGLDDFPVQTP
ncbi:MAG: SRPBCC family protein [Gemmatimonadota bacterium]|nr:SRPBCC family protein [Gemmatimonadota bacterium]